MLAGCKLHGCSSCERVSVASDMRGGRLCEEVEKALTQRVVSGPRAFLR